MGYIPWIPRENTMEFMGSSSHGLPPMEFHGIGLLWYALRIVIIIVTIINHAWL